MAAAPVSLVSGAASGIGRHLACVLAERGHALVLIDRDLEGLRALCQEQSWQDRPDIRVHALDVRDPDGWQSLVQQTVAHFGRIDHALNVAGYLAPGYLHETSAETLALHVDINVKGVMYATRAVAQQMLQQGSGHILNVASIAGLSHVPGMSAYCASKHAVRGFSLAVAHELRPKGVHVTVLCPDAVETPMLTAQEGRPEAAMTFGAKRALSVQEVERAVLDALRDRPLEVVLDVPWSGRALGARLSNMFPDLTGLALERIVKQGRRMQAKRTAR